MQMRCSVLQLITSENGAAENGKERKTARKRIGPIARVRLRSAGIRMSEPCFCDRMF